MGVLICTTKLFDAGFPGLFSDAMSTPVVSRDTDTTVEYRPVDLSMPPPITVCEVKSQGSVMESLVLLARTPKADDTCVNPIVAGIVPGNTMGTVMVYMVRVALSNEVVSPGTRQIFVTPEDCSDSVQPPDCEELKSDIINVTSKCM